MRTLKELVSKSLSEADQQLKLASASDAVVRGEDGDFDFLGTKTAFEDDSFPGRKSDDESDEKKRKEKEESKKKSEKDKDEKEKRAEIAYAADISKALLLAVPIAEKLAEMEKTAAAGHSPLNAPGPKVMKAEDKGQTRLPKPGPVSAPTGDNAKAGPQGTLPTNKPDYKSPDWTKNKEAAVAFIEAKTKQANLLAELGQTEAADQIRLEIEATRSKVAEDPSSPQAVLPGKGNGGKSLAVDPPVPSGRVGDNASLINMTKGQALDPTTRTTKEHVQQPPKKDPVVAATQLSAAGVKISSVLAKYAPAEGEKTAKNEDLGKEGFFETAARGNQVAREHKGLQIGANGLIGAGIGGLAGHSMVSPGSPKKQLAAAALGALLGGASMGTLGHHVAEGERKARIRRTREEENA